MRLVLALALLAAIAATAQENPHARLMERAHPTPEIHGSALPLMPWVLTPTVGGLFPNANMIVEENDQLPAQNESSIAVNPRNPNNLIGSAVDYRGNSSTWAYYSFDGGRTWENVTLGRARPGWASANDPSVAFDRNGKGYLCYGGFNRTSNAQFGENGIFVSTTTDGGRTWNQQHVAVIIHTGQQTADSAFEDKYYIHVDTSSSSPYVDHIYIPWKRVINADSSTQIVIAKSTDGGATWLPPVNVSDRFPQTSEDTTFGQSFPLARTGPDGTVHVVWNSGTERAVRYAKSTDGGATFSQPRIIHRYTSFGVKSSRAGQVNSRVKGVVRAEAYPTLVVDNTNGPRRGWLYLVWSADTIPNVYFSRSSDQGATWTPPVVVHSDTTNDQFWPWIALDPLNGELGVMYFDSRNDAANILVETYVSWSNDGGTTWIDRRVGDGVNDLRLNPFSGNTFAGDYSGCDFYGGVIHPSWVDMRNSVVNIADNDVYTARVRVRAPAPPVPFDARTLVDTVDAVHLTWGAVTSLTFGQPLDPASVQYLLFRDGERIATLPGTTTTYLDAGRTPYTLYHYEIRSATASDTSGPVRDTAWAGGSPQPGMCELLEVAGTEDGLLRYTVRLPRLRADGVNPLVNLAGVAVHARNVKGTTTQTFTVPPSDTGRVITLTMNAPGRGWYDGWVYAVDANQRQSASSDTLFAFAGALVPYLERFDSVPNFRIVEGTWARTEHFAFSQPASYTDSPNGPYQARRRDEVWLYPMRSAVDATVELSYRVAAFVARLDSAIVEYRYGTQGPWLRAASHNAEDEARWADTTKGDDAWRFIAVQCAPPRFDGDTLYARLRFTSNLTIQSDGVYVDDFGAALVSSVQSDNPRIIGVHPVPAQQHVVIGVNGFTEIHHVTFVSVHGNEIDVPWQLHGNTIVVDVQSLANGMYVVRLGNHRRVLTVPVVVMR
jgi:hypothetical protein